MVWFFNEFFAHQGFFWQIFEPTKFFGALFLPALQKVWPPLDYTIFLKLKYHVCCSDLSVIQILNIFLRQYLAKKKQSQCDYHVRFSVVDLGTWWVIFLGTALRMAVIPEEHWFGKTARRLVVLKAIREKNTRLASWNPFLNTCCGTGISLWVRGLFRIKSHPEYQSLQRSSTSLIISRKWNAHWELKIVCISMLISISSYVVQGTKETGYIHAIVM